MITAQPEAFSACIEEAKPLLFEHWRELALNQDKVPLDPCWDVYAAKESVGELLVVTLREQGRLIGYFCGCVSPGMHYRGCLTLIMDIFYVDPSSRGRHAGVKLFREVEREARRRSVQRWFVGSKVHKDASRLFEALGFAPVETYYSKWLGN